MSGATIWIGLTLATWMAAATPAADHVDAVMEWRISRLTSLTSPDSWLSLVGLHWLENGTHLVGASADDNDLVLNAGPDRLGELAVAGRQVRFHAAPGVAIALNGQPVDNVVMALDTTGEPTILQTGSMSFYVIERGDRLALRVKDAAAPTRVGFTGLDYFPIKPEFRAVADFEPHPEGTIIDIVDVNGMVQENPNPGRLVFELGGEEFTLEAVGEPGEDLFIIFADRTNGKSTYGAGRFLYTPWPEGGTTVLDFNRSYNPPCVFTEYSTCPLPPQSNRLRIAVEAGEKVYQP